MSANAASSPAQSTLPKRAFAIIFCSSVATAIGNTGLISVLPLIGRSLAIPDEMVVAIFSLSAILWACSSPFWAKASDRYGRKPLMMVGLSGFMVSMTVCGVVVSAGLRHMAAPMMIFGMLLLGRSLFGLFGAASNPANQAYVADHTPRAERTQAMASLAGAFGLGTVFGPWLAPYFIYPVIGLAGPLFTFAGIAAVMLVVVWRLLPESRRAQATPEDLAAEALEQTTEKARPMWRDPRVVPFALYGFVVATCQTAQQQTIGFLVIDKLNVSPMMARDSIAMAMAFGAIAGLLAQWGLIRMFQMTPKQLLRWGVVYALASLGFGFARPGFTAGASLAVGWKDQARVAGAIAAVNGINAVFAPAFMALYRANHAAPFFLNMALMLGLLVYAFVSKPLRNADPVAVTREEATMATIERSDEGGA